MNSRFLTALVSISLVFLFTQTAYCKDLRTSRAETVGMSTERLQNIGISLRRLIDARKIAGTVSLVARKGKVVHFEANGLNDVGAEQVMTTDAIFRLYSQTKPVTGVAVMMLFEQGYFLLSDPISKFLPEFKDMQVYLGEKDGERQTEPARPITIHQLLTHTSGLSYDFIDSPVANMYKKAGVMGADSQSPLTSLDEWVKALAKQPLISQPGEKWNYSVGMDVLGRLVEVVSGRSFRDFLQQNIFQPLDMQDTDFYVPADKVERFTVMYTPDLKTGIKPIDGAKVSPYLALPKIEMGGSGLVGTVKDYFAFAQMLANRGQYKGKRLLGKKTVEFMMSNHLTPNFAADPLSNVAAVTTGHGRAWGVGFGLTGSVVTNPAIAGLPVSKGTFGWGGAASTVFWVDLEEQIVGIVHTQLIPSGFYPIGELTKLATYQAIID
ncbi:MAG: CubicO group peptidase (beta-lactamase class C family) [Arenicella sp.]|jgi:CubicO group peptidase (beta-lactamase class C family)